MDGTIKIFGSFESAIQSKKLAFAENIYDNEWKGDSGQFQSLINDYLLNRLDEFTGADGSSSRIVQTTGTSVSNIMSQNAVTKALESVAISPFVKDCLQRANGIFTVTSDIKNSDQSTNDVYLAKGYGLVDVESGDVKFPAECNIIGKFKFCGQDIEIVNANAKDNQAVITQFLINGVATNGYLLEDGAIKKPTSFRGATQKYEVVLAINFNGTAFTNSVILEPRLPMFVGATTDSMATMDNASKLKYMVIRSKIGGTYTVDIPEGGRIYIIIDTLYDPDAKLTKVVTNQGWEIPFDEPVKPRKMPSDTTDGDYNIYKSSKTLKAGTVTFTIS